MDKTTIYALVYRGSLLDLAEDKAGEFPPEIVRSWTLEHEAYTGAVALKVGKRLAEERLGPAYGTDAETLAVARGLYAMEETVKGWDWKSQDVADIPVDAVNMAALPPLVLRGFWARVVRGGFPSDEEIEAMKLPLEKRSPASTPPAA